ncbi:MAG: YdbL family protein [Marinobacter sp.]|uniref:YdbL family protein n=1 Tax=Marinobacter sp. TaxID=50741 RepID=UPI0034A07814
MKRSAKFTSLAMALCLSLPAFGISLNEAKNELDSVKQQGQVGETPTGYLDVVDSDGRAREIVDAINEARRQEYTRIAQKHDIPVTQVETVAGEKAIEKTPSGQFVLIEGQWVKK